MEILHSTIRGNTFYIAFCFKSILLRLDIVTDDDVSFIGRKILHWKQQNDR